MLHSIESDTVSQKFYVCYFISHLTEPAAVGCTVGNDERDTMLVRSAGLLALHRGIEARNELQVRSSRLIHAAGARIADRPCMHWTQPKRLQGSLCR
eukprot:SAG31_NODE_831_length_11669_cov_3.410026_7_plen_97_part_00